MIAIDRIAPALCAALLGGCLLRPSPPAPPIDCEADRAAERYPEVCDGGPVDEEDAGPGEDEDAGEADAGDGGTDDS